MATLDTGQLPLSGEALLWFHQGLAAAAGEEYEQAVESYDRVLEIRPDFYEAWYERGLAMEAWGYYTQAIASFDHALALRPNKEVASQIWHERGNALQYGLGEYVDAIACYDQALKMYPELELAWQNRGNALLYGLSRPEDAIACYDRALHINSDSYLAWRNRGNALVELRRHTEAIASYDRALEINPDDDISWHARNLASERSGLVYRLPTTSRVASESDFDKPTFIEAETDTWITFSSDQAAADQIPFTPSTYSLLVIEDDQGKRELFLEQDQYIIGRDPQGDIQLNSQFASRQHAVLKKILKSDGTCAHLIVDGSPDGKPSTNGLIVNGHKLRSRELQTNDVIVFGPGVQAVYCLVAEKPLDSFQ